MSEPERQRRAGALLPFAGAQALTPIRKNMTRATQLCPYPTLPAPPETRRPTQKHAEFYGRLRGQGKAKLRLSYDIVSENLDGSRKVDVRTSDVEVAIPAEPAGPASIFKEWAQHQNAHFLNLLNYYPDETFFQ